MKGDSAPVEVENEPADMEEDVQENNDMNKEEDQREEEMHSESKRKQ